MAKVLEGLLHDLVYPVVQPAISKFQHGFVKKRSTISNLMAFTSTATNTIEKRHQVDTIYVDFSKAFDKVPHDLAVAKLSRLGLPSWIVTWIDSYLSSRKAFVKIRNTRSDVFDIPSGVPQGSLLGPLIFILFINDVCDHLCSCKLLYADDLKIYRIVKSVLDCCALQSDIDRLTSWCRMNGMQTNPSKCKVITYTRKHEPIRFEYSMDSAMLQRVYSIKDLGITLDSKLKFNEHISKTIAKANSMLGFLRRNTADFDDIYALKALYCSLVRSGLEYGVQIWAPYRGVHELRIENVQKRFVRFALRRLPWIDARNLPPYEHRCALIGLQTLTERQTFLRRMFIFDMLTNRIDCSCLLQRISFRAPNRQLRVASLLWIPGHRTDYGRNNPLDRSCELFNAVYDEFDFNVSRIEFKNRIKYRSV